MDNPERDILAANRMFRMDCIKKAIKASQKPPDQRTIGDIFALGFAKDLEP